MLKALFYLAVLLIQTASASLIVFPSVPNPEFNTPVATNGGVGGPTHFSVIANATIHRNCDTYSAKGMIVIIAAGGCSRESQYKIAVEAGASGLMLFDFERDFVGRKSRIPISNTPLKIPVVIISAGDFIRINETLASSPYVTLEMTPGVSEWHKIIGDTGWFLALNALFGAFYVVLLTLVIFKFVRKIKDTGFIWNISFVYLLFQGAFCILMIVRWVDPDLTYGLYIVGIDALIDTWPGTWSFAALVLMAFFWFEVINQFADTKVQPFLSKKMQIPFWIVVAILILLPPINAILLTYKTSLTLFVALMSLQFATGMIIGGFYIIVAIKALQVLKRSEQLNTESKSRIGSLKRSRVSIISSAIIACVYPPLNFVLRYNILYKSFIYALASLYVESLLLGVITFIQVWFMPDKKSTSAPSSPRVHELPMANLDDTPTNTTANAA